MGGEGAGEFEEGRRWEDGERVEARDLRRPWADEGRFGTGVVVDSGEEGDQGLSSRAAVSWEWV